MSNAPQRPATGPARIGQLSGEISQAVVDLLSDLPTEAELLRIPVAAIEKSLAELAAIDEQLILSMEETLFWLAKRKTAMVSKKSANGGR